MIRRDSEFNSYSQIISAIYYNILWICRL
jgi:hypothetical protein